MKPLSEYSSRFARILIAMVFVINGIGVIHQTIPAKEMMERHSGQPVWTIGKQ